MSLTIGFACHWGADRRVTWSGTPLQLRNALEQLTPVVDLDVTVDPRLQYLLKAAAIRRDAGGWHAKWRHGRAAHHVIERKLAAEVAAAAPDVVLEIGDLAPVERPYAIVQDLSYDLLLEQFGPDGVPHFRGLTRNQITRLRERQLQVYAGAAAAFPMSTWLADNITRTAMPTGRVHVVNPGVNAPLDPDVPVPERGQGPTRRLLFIGRDFETKAGDQVLAAFELLRADLGAAIELTIAGPKVWPGLGAPPPGVNYLGPVPVARVQELYDTHDLFVMPSRFEGFGIAFVEALVRGLPCIGRDACAMPEIITHSDGGRLVRSEDPTELAELIVTTLADDALYQACAAAAPLRREHYTWSRAANQVITALRTLY
jgi:glycosyltransferase involved in cell wall biosynthesis